MEQFEIEKNLPLSSNVYNKILELIKNESFKLGEKLSSEKEMSKKFRVSRSVLREALQRLEVDGYIVRKHGVGTFVSSNVPKLSSGLEKLNSMTELIKKQGLEPGTINMIIRKIQVTNIIAEHLQIQENIKVAQLERVRTADKQPFAFDTLTFSPKVVKQEFKLDYV